MAEIRVKNLGLAGFVKMGGGKLITFNKGHYVFESTRNLCEWEVEYLNSCCSKHDDQVMSLRQLRNKFK